MAVIYTAIGLYLMTHPYFLGEGFNRTSVSIFGALLILFGIFRGYRAWFIERKA